MFGRGRVAIEGITESSDRSRPRKTKASRALERLGYEDLGGMQTMHILATDGVYASVEGDRVVFHSWNPSPDGARSFRTPATLGDLQAAEQRHRERLVVCPRPGPSRRGFRALLLAAEGMQVEVPDFALRSVVIWVPLHQTDRSLPISMRVVFDGALHLETHRCGLQDFDLQLEPSHLRSKLRGTDVLWLVFGHAALGVQGAPEVLDAIDAVLPCRPSLSFDARPPWRGLDLVAVMVGMVVAMIHDAIRSPTPGIYLLVVLGWILVMLWALYVDLRYQETASLGGDGTAGVGWFVPWRKVDALRVLGRRPFAIQAGERWLWLPGPSPLARAIAAHARQLHQAARAPSTTSVSAGPFRSPALARDAHVALLEDPSASPTLRLAAALARRDEPGGQQHAHALAHSVAHASLRRGLCAIAFGRHDAGDALATLARECPLTPSERRRWPTLAALVDATEA